MPKESVGTESSSSHAAAEQHSSQEEGANGVAIPSPDSVQQVNAVPATEEEIEQYVHNFLGDHASDVISWLDLGSHPTLDGKKFGPEKPPKKQVTLVAARFAPEQPQQGEVMQRVVAPAQRNNTFNSGAAKALTGAGFPVMGGAAYGGSTAYSTGNTASRNGINNAAYGSGVGGHRPTGWQAFENLTGSNPWKQLHLLNDNLGGLGQASNLAPGSTSFNSQHLNGAEAPVKNWAGTSSANTSADQAADYDVTATYGNPGGVQNEVVTMYDATFNYNTRRTNAVNNAMPAAIQSFINQRNQDYKNNIYPMLFMQYMGQYVTYQNQLNANHQAYLNHQFLPYPFAVAPIPPILPALYNHIPTMVEVTNVYNSVYNYFTNQLNTQVTNDKNTLANYVAAVFPSAFTCHATFYGKDVNNATEATAQQTVVIDYQ